MCSTSLIDLRPGANVTMFTGKQYLLRDEIVISLFLCCWALCTGCPDVRTERRGKTDRETDRQTEIDRQTDRQTVRLREAGRERKKNRFTQTN